MPGARPSILSKSIMFLVSLLEFEMENEKPAGEFAGGLVGSFDLVGRLVQAIAVRRHGMSMMVVMAVMMADLHLFLTICEMALDVKPFRNGTRAAFHSAHF